MSAPAYSPAGSFTAEQNPRFQATRQFPAQNYGPYNSSGNGRFRTASRDAFGYQFFGRDSKSLSNSQQLLYARVPVAPTSSEPSLSASQEVREAPVAQSSETAKLSSTQPLPMAKTQFMRSTGNFGITYARPRTPPTERPGLLHHHRAAIQLNGKESVSRRLNTGEHLRYHLPGYQGYVPTEQFRFSESFGKTTNRAIEASYRHPWTYSKSSLMLTLSPTTSGRYVDDNFRPN